MAWMPLRLGIAPPPPPPSSLKPILLSPPRLPPPPASTRRLCCCLPPITTGSNLLRTFNITKPPAAAASAAAAFSSNKLKPPPPGFLEALVDLAKFLADPRVLIPCVLACSASMIVAPAVFRSRYPTVPFETTIWGALALPLATVIATAVIELLLPSRVCHQSSAFVLPLVWFLYNWKTNFVRKTLDVMRANGSHPDDVASVEKFSSFCSTYLYGMVCAYIFSDALVYFLLSLVFIGVPFLYSNRNTIVWGLPYSRFEQTGPNSSIDVSINVKRKKSVSPGTGSGVGRTPDGVL